MRIAIFNPLFGPKYGLKIAKDSSRIVESGRFRPGFRQRVKWVKIGLRHERLRLGGSFGRRDTLIPIRKTRLPLNELKR